MKVISLLQEYKNMLYKKAYIPKPLRDEIEIVEENGAIIIQKKQRKYLHKH